MAEGHPRDLSFDVSGLHLVGSHRFPVDLDLLGTKSIEIGLEQACFVFLFYGFSSFEHVKSLLIMGPKTLKTHH
jgi:hypothetical protein